MDPLIASVIITWLLMRAGRVVKNEWQHSRDTHGNDLARQHPDWSPGRVRRNARRRARADWLTELRDGFPSLRQSLAEDRLLARTVREERRAAGDHRVRGLHERLNAASEQRRAAIPEPEMVHCDPDAGASGAGDPVPLPADRVPRLRPVPAPGQRCRVCLKPGSDADPLVPAGIGVAHRSHIETGEVILAAARDHVPGPRLNDTQRERDADPRLRTACAACGNDGTAGDPLVVHPDGYRVHESHTTDPDSGLYVPPDPEPPLFDGDPVNPRSPAYVEPPDEAALYDDETEIVTPGTMQLVTDQDGEHLALDGWVIRGPSLADGPLDSQGVRDALGGYTIGGLHRMSHGEDCGCPLSRHGDRDRRLGDFPVVRGADGGPFPEPADDNWPTGIPHRRSGDAPSPATNGGTVTDMQIDTALENADTPHEAMQGAFRQIGAKAAQFAQAASDDLAAAAAVHGMDRDPQTMADIAALADHAQALQAQANAAATGLASRHAEGAEYHGNGQDANASAFRPS